MLSVAFALVLFQTPVVDKPAPTVHLRATPKAGVNCPMNGAIVASNPTITRPNAANGPPSNYPDLVHLPPTALMEALNRTVNGCFAPLILTVDVTAAAPKSVQTPSGPGVR